MHTTASPTHQLPEVAPVVRRASGPSRFIGPILYVLVAGLAVGRFITADSPSPATPAASATAPATLNDLRVAVETDPTSADSWVVYGDALLQAAVTSGDRGEYLAAKDAFDTALHLAPDSPETLTARARFALNAHDFARALTLAERAVGLSPYNPTALAALVDARVETGRYTEANAALTDLLNVEPGVTAYARVSYLRELTGDIDGARVAMQQAVASAGPGATRASVRVFLGDLQLESGRVDAADEAYRQALLDKPSDAAATVGRARVLIARGSLTEAAALLDLAIGLGPETTPAIVRGEVALLMNDPAAADAAFEIARIKDQKLRDRGEATDLESASFLADHGDSAEAVVRARAAYKVRTNVLGADALAWALFTAGDLEQALPMIDKALAGGITRPSVRVHAAAILAAAGDLERARQELAVAFEGSPWTNLSIRPVAIQLAEDVGMQLPETWSDL